jgi:hypothetical protein
MTRSHGHGHGHGRRGAWPGSAGVARRAAGANLVALRGGGAAMRGGGCESCDGLREGGARDSAQAASKRQETACGRPPCGAGASAGQGALWLSGPGHL